MSRDGSGTYTLPNPTFTAGTAVSSAAVNANNADLSTALTGSLPRDGQAAPTANIPFGGYKITGLGAGSALTDSATFGQVQAQAYAWCSVGGTADAITLTPAPAITAYAAGQCFRFIASGANTTAVTVNVSSVGAKDVKKTEGGAAAALIAGDIKAAGVYAIIYDGTQFRLFDDRLVKYADIQDVSATKRALGRNSSGAGDVEEVTATQLLDWVGTAAQGDILYRGASAWAYLPAGTDGHFLKTKGAAANPEWAAQTTYLDKVVQVVNSTVTSYITGTTAIPQDDTIPQQTEGFEVMTLAITPTSATNKLIIDIVVSGISNATSSDITVALFQDSTANALAAWATNSGIGWGGGSFRFYMTSGTTSATTMKVRIGGTNTNSTRINGTNSARLFGGVSASSITITEVK